MIIVCFMVWLAMLYVTTMSLLWLIGVVSVVVANAALVVDVCVLLLVCCAVDHLYNIVAKVVVDVLLCLHALQCVALFLVVDVVIVVNMIIVADMCDTVSFVIVSYHDCCICVCCVDVAMLLMMLVLLLRLSVSMCGA